MWAPARRMSLSAWDSLDAAQLAPEGGECPNEREEVRAGGPDADSLPRIALPPAVAGRTAARARPGRSYTVETTRRPPRRRLRRHEPGCPSIQRAHDAPTHAARPSQPWPSWSEPARRCGGNAERLLGRRKALRYRSCLLLGGPLPSLRRHGLSVLPASGLRVIPRSSCRGPYPYWRTRPRRARTSTRPDRRSPRA